MIKFAFQGKKITQLHSIKQMMEEIIRLRAIFSYPERKMGTPEGRNGYKTGAKRVDLQCHSGERLAEFGDC